MNPQTGPADSGRILQSVQPRAPRRLARLFHGSATTMDFRNSMISACRLSASAKNASLSMSVPAPVRPQAWLAAIVGIVLGGSDPPSGDPFFAARHRKARVAHARIGVAIAVDVSVDEYVTRIGAY